jgi:hypothetical protein
MKLERFPEDDVAKLWLAAVKEQKRSRFAGLNPAIKIGDPVSPDSKPSLRCLLEKVATGEIRETTFFGFQCVSDASLERGKTMMVLIFLVNPASSTARYLEKQTSVIYGSIE